MTGRIRSVCTRTEILLLLLLRREGVLIRRVIRAPPAVHDDNAIITIIIMFEWKRGGRGTGDLLLLLSRPAEGEQGIER